MLKGKGIKIFVLPLQQFLIVITLNMKIKTYIFMLAVFLVFTTAGTKKSGIREGFRLGDNAPKIKLADAESDIIFTNHSSRYTLLHFWAAYDGNSRKQNVLLWNYIRKGNLPQVQMISVSMDSSHAVFTETVKTDGLDSTRQEQVGQGKEAEALRKYGLKNGFRNFLIDDKGVIIATQVTSEILDSIVN
jgi:hypothetical protein